MKEELIKIMDEIPTTDKGHLMTDEQMAMILLTISKHLGTDRTDKLLSICWMTYNLTEDEKINKEKENVK